MRFPSRRWHLWLFAALLLVGAVALGCALALAPSSSNVTEANFERLQVGMTSEQVDEILGAENQGPGRGTRSCWMQTYSDEDGDVAIVVTLNRDRLTDKEFRWLPRTLGDFLLSRLAKVRRRLRL